MVFYLLSFYSYAIGRKFVEQEYTHHSGYSLRCLFAHLTVPEQNNQNHNQTQSKQTHLMHQDDVSCKSNEPIMILMMMLSSLSAAMMIMMIMAPADCKMDITIIYHHYIILAHSMFAFLIFVAPYKLSFKFSQLAWTEVGLVAGWSPRLCHVRFFLLLYLIGLDIVKSVARAKCFAKCSQILQTYIYFETSYIS